MLKPGTEEVLYKHVKRDESKKSLQPSVKKQVKSNTDMTRDVNCISLCSRVLDF